MQKAGFLITRLTYHFSYILNTTVEQPHDQRVAALEFRPVSEVSDVGTELMLVTSSGDGKFKTWLLVDDTDIYSKGLHQY